ncbi:MAG: hypothetical protein RIS79_1805 [Verrucomicrobiota bacterium]
MLKAPVMCPPRASGMPRWRGRRDIGGGHGVEEDHTGLAREQMAHRGHHDFDLVALIARLKCARREAGQALMAVLHALLPFLEGCVAAFNLIDLLSCLRPLLHEGLLTLRMLFFSIYSLTGHLVKTLLSARVC